MKGEIATRGQYCDLIASPKSKRETNIKRVKRGVVLSVGVSKRQAVCRMKADAKTRVLKEEGELKR